MSDSDLPERKPRKSVAFADGETIVDHNGDLTGTNGAHDGEKDGDKQVDEINAMFEGLGKKKKKKPKKDDGEAGGEEKAADDGELDLAALKKKKKKKPKTTGDDFEAKLAEVGADEGGAEDTADTKEEETGVQQGDLVEGTGVWAHDSTVPLNYDSLLHRFFELLHERNPEFATSSLQKLKIPPPQCLREGNKKTIFANLAEICKRLKRTDEHVTQFLFAELGTSGSVDGSRRLVIKGRFQQKQIENVLRQYIIEYVNCKTCKGTNTELSKGENRLYFVTCNACGSRRSVTAIKTGFSAQVGKRKRQQG